ncbi:MAG: hypothetical protein CL693_01265 [Cellvibrionaceae bacterium]|nr:hypothetical protein [Cellvibrionaceae bacterium]
MWLNREHTTDAAIEDYKSALNHSHPRHLVIDNLFDANKLESVARALHHTSHWKTQQHTYSELYVDKQQWQQASPEERFVQRDSWRPEFLQPQGLNLERGDTRNDHVNAREFLNFLRGDDFMAFLSRVFKVSITDINVEDPDINTAYFRLSREDFVEQHADDSPGRKVCMLLYLNRDWNCDAGGQLVFKGIDDNPISIAPLYNRCVLFDPSSEGSEHWVEALSAKAPQAYRYNITSWYWSE